MSYVSTKCPHCGANIEIDDSKKKGTCPYCGTTFVNEEKKAEPKAADTAKPKEKKKKIKPAHIIAILIIFIVQVGIVAGFITNGNAPLDKILLYKIDTKISEDGRMENTYYIEWKVLRNAEDPLTWIEVGMANANFEIIDFGRNVIRAYPGPDKAPSKEWVICDLQYAFNKGQTAKIEFTVRQSDMLCYENGEYFYEFIPGWFEEIEVESYEFNWIKDDRIISDNADTETADTLTWKGSLKNNESRVIKVGYNSAAFSEDQAVSYIPFEMPASSGSSFNPHPVFFFLIFLAFALFFVQIGIIAGAVSYYRGRGFIFFGGYHHHGHHRGGRGGHGGGGGGGGCACACAGCACACACAGGGRAGCSLKDFYSTKDDDKKNEDENPA